MEEDIKTLEELLKASKENDMYEGNKYFKSLNISGFCSPS